MCRILIVSEDFVLQAVAFSLNDLDACVECADTVGAMLVLHRESPFDLVIVMGTAAEMCRQEVMDTLRADKTRRYAGLRDLVAAIRTDGTEYVPDGREPIHDLCR